MTHDVVTRMVLLMAHNAMQTAMSTIQEHNSVRAAAVLRHVSQAIQAASNGSWEAAVEQMSKAAVADKREAE